MPSEISSTLDFQSETYRDAYSRINAIVIQGEQHAYENFLDLARLLPEHEQELLRLARMESRHQKSFQTCGQNLQVSPDLDFAHRFFSELHQNFQEAANNEQIVTCLLIQALLIECFAIAAYNLYIPVADDFACKITKGVVKDEHAHLNFGEVWLKDNFAAACAELKAANRQNLPIVWRMLNQVEKDAATIGIAKSALIENFMTHYGDALHRIGFALRDVLKMITHGLATP